MLRKPKERLLLGHDC